MEESLEARTASGGNGRRRPVQSKSGVSSRREESVTEACSDEEGGNHDAVRNEEAVPASKQKKVGRSVKKIQSVEDVEAEIRRLKAPPRVLTREDFHREYNLPLEGDNPHRFRKNTVRAEAVKKLFGGRYGDAGRAGFCWLNCKVPEVVARVKFLHPILYQHGPGEIPNNVKVKFAEGVTFEYEEGAGFVDWCAFGAEKNERQRSRYKQDLSKLLALRKSFEGKGPVDVRGKEWRSIKVEPGTEGEREGGTFDSKRKPLPAKTEGGEGGLGSCLAETGDCDGNFESGMGSGVCVQGSVQDRSEGLVGWRKGLVQERLKELEGLIGVLHLELKAMAVKKVQCLERTEAARSKCKQRTCLVDSCKHQIQQKSVRIDVLEAEGLSSVREKIKMEGIQEQLEEEEAQMRVDLGEQKAAELELEGVAAMLEGRQKLFDALSAENFQLKRGKSNASIWPRPMVYSESSDAAVVGSQGAPAAVEITACCLCLFPFPCNDVVISCCRHLYHPFCASVVFVNCQACVAKGCGAIPHPDWYNSFGWGHPSPEMRDRGRQLGVVQERSRVLQARASCAKEMLPSNGTFSFNVYANDLLSTVGSKFVTSVYFV